jgi:magnesium transporter
MKSVVMMPPAVSSSWVSSSRTSTERSEEVRELLSYPEDTAGGLMTPDFISLKVDFTVDQTIAVLRQEARDAESIYYLYVLDDLGHLVGVVTLRSLIVANPERRLGELMSTRVISVTTGEDKGTAAELFAKYRFRALPVVDRDGVMKGIITVDDVLEDMAPELAR